MSRRRLARPSRLPRPARAVALVAAGALVAGVAAFSPVTPSEPAEAALPSTVTGWASTLNTALSDTSKIFTDVADPWSEISDLLSAAGFVIPLMSTQAPNGPSLTNVMDALGDIQNQLTSLQSTLDAVETDVLRTEADAVTGECVSAASQLESWRTTIRQIHENYAQIVQNVSDDPTDVDDIAQATGAFVKAVLDGETDVIESPMVNDLIGIDGGLTDPDSGAILACGQMGLQLWQDANTLGDAVSPNAWLDDRQYYGEVTTFLKFWQVVQAQGMFMLEQAALIQAGALYTAAGGRLDVGDVCATILTTAPVVPGARELCNSTEQYLGSFHETIRGQWQDAGVPYSDDDVVLSLGTGITGLDDAGGNPIPTVAWLRDPRASTIDWARAPQPWDTDATAAPFAGLSGWLPADGAQWQALSDGYTAANPGETPAAVAPLQPTTNWILDSFQTADLPPFAPVDVLTKMADAFQPEGIVDSWTTPAFAANDVDQVWIPNQLTSRNLISTFDPVNNDVWLPDAVPFAGAEGLAFPNWEWSNWEQENDTYLPYYGDDGLFLRCMVAKYDGVLCQDEEAVGSWWVARQSTTYTLADLGELQTAVWTITPTDTLVTPLSIEASSTCALYPGSVDGPGICPLGITGVSSMPPWLDTVTPVSGTAGPFTPPPTPAQLWPAFSPNVSTDPDLHCITLWQVPTRCGADFTAWAEATLPDPSAPTPEAETRPTVKAADSAGALDCTDPTWADAPGETVGYRDTTWSAVDGAGTPATLAQAHGTSMSIDALVASNPGGDWHPASLSITCTVTASFDGAPTATDVPSVAIPVTRSASGWLIDTPPPARVARDPETASARRGEAHPLTAAVVTSDHRRPGDAETHRAGMAGGVSGGHVAAARVAAAPAAGVTVGWERRPLGSDTWQAVPGGTTSAEPATSSSTPRVLAQTLTTSTLDATEAGSYRAVFTTPDGTIVTAVAELTILPDGSLAATGTNASPWGGIWPALLLVGIGGALLVVVRRSGRRA